MNARNRILNELKKKPRSLQELKLLTGYNRNGLRGRVSELRAMGRKIKLNKKTRKYEYVSGNGEWVFEEEDFIRDHFFQMKTKSGQQLTIEKMAKRFNRTVKQVTKKLRSMGMILYE